jgi:hypothetical protein
MQYLLSLVYLVLLPAVCASGQGAPTVIAGKVAHPRQPSIVIGDTTVPLSGSGEFTYRVDLSEPPQFAVKHGEINFEIFAEPGEKLSLSFNADQFPERVQFIGPSAAINALLLQLQPVSNHLGRI